MRTRIGRFAFSRLFYIIAGGAASITLILLFPLFVLTDGIPEHEPLEPVPFPVSVNPVTRTISENPEIEATLSRGNYSLTSAALNAGDFMYVLAAVIAAAPWYQLLASPLAPSILVIEPGYRKEQVAEAVGGALRWSRTEKDSFVKAMRSDPAPLEEGRIFPGIYAVEGGTGNELLKDMFRDRFERKVLARYSTTTEAIVPLATTLTIASMIEREAGDENEMRVISGIMWNRIFANMKLQIDATLQYAKATGKNGWWPVVRSRDKYIRSAYNTYQNGGLPPGPIANPSVAAIVAALNPKKTPCFYYFHDAERGFHCSETYEGHVALLKEYYGRGK
ncbi:MAG: endolytic transglycosylase MltG [Patescibacteria group bacterium]